MKSISNQLEENPTSDAAETVDDAPGPVPATSPAAEAEAATVAPPTTDTRTNRRKTAYPSKLVATEQTDGECSFCAIYWLGLALMAKGPKRSFDKK